MRYVPPSLLLLALWAPACGDDDNTGTADTTATTQPDSGDDVADVTADIEPDTAPDVSRPPDESEIATLLADEEVSLLLGVSRPFSFVVPEHAVSVTISVLGDAGSSFALDSWQQTSSELVKPGWLARDQSGICTACAERITISQAVFAAIAPNNPAVTLEPGAHEVTLLGFTPAVVQQNEPAGCGDDVCAFFDQFQCADTDCGSEPYTGIVKVTVIAKVLNDGATLPDTGVLDLNLHFTGAQGMTADVAKSDATFQGYLDSMRTIYGAVGITLGEITYRDIDERFQFIESTDGPESELQELYRQSEGNALNALDLYFVDEISAGALGGFGAILGIAGGIPGPPLMQGTHRSGVAIALKPVQGVPSTPDLTMSHESGHFLGLFHTSEQSFGFGDQLHDPLPDTPENDQTYLMFNNPTGTRLSPWQGRVMRSNPWVRHPIATEP